MTTHFDYSSSLDTSYSIIDSFESFSESSDIFQLDGNFSFSSSPLHQATDESFIEVIVGNRPPPKLTKPNQRLTARKTIRRDNRGELSLYLPNMAVYNHRSIWKKLKNFCLEFGRCSWELLSTQKYGKERKAKSIS